MYETRFIGRCVLVAVAVSMVGACSSPQRAHTGSESHQVHAGCIMPDASLEGKRQLENGMRGPVKFLGEQEDFRSITATMAEYGIPALSLAILKEGTIAWAEIYQHADSSDERRLDCTSLFQAASLSKPVTFLAAVRMEAAGDIDLDADIEQYLEDYVLPPGEQTPDNPVTFRNIFSHTSGISPGGFEGYARDVALPSDIDILRGRAGVNSPAIRVIAPPNSTLTYSGGAYTLAELALQDIYDEAFANIMDEWMLAPAGMGHSDFSQPLPPAKFSQAAQGHLLSGEVADGGWRNYPEQAAAGLWSTSIDLARLLTELYKAYHGDGTLFAPSAIPSLIGHERDGLAYGFIVDRSDSHLAITHYGGNAGYRTGMTIDLTTGNGLVYMTNSDNGGMLGNELLWSAAQVYGWHHFTQTEVARTDVDAHVLRALTGTYRWNDQVDLSIAFDEQSSRISLHFPNGDAYALTPIVGEALDFIHPTTGVVVSFSRTEDVPSFTLYGQRAVKSTRH